MVALAGANRCVDDFPLAEDDGLAALEAALVADPVDTDAELPVEAAADVAAVTDALLWHAVSSNAASNATNAATGRIREPSRLPNNPPMGRIVAHTGGNCSRMPAGAR